MQRRLPHLSPTRQARERDTSSATNGNTVQRGGKKVVASNAEVNVNDKVLEVM